MTEALDVVGLLAVTAAAFLVGLSAGFAVLGAGCLWLSWSITRRAGK